MQMEGAINREAEDGGDTQTWREGHRDKERLVAGSMAGAEPKGQGLPSPSLQGPSSTFPGRHTGTPVPDPTKEWRKSGKTSWRQQLGTIGGEECQPIRE